MGGTSVELATLQDVACCIGHTAILTPSTTWFVQGEFLFRSVSATGEPGVSTGEQGAELIYSGWCGPLTPRAPE
jgi:hypothetical protein